MEALNWWRLNTPKVCWSCAVDEHLMMAWNLKLSNLSKTKPKKTFFLIKWNWHLPLLQGGLVSFEVHYVQPNSLNDHIFFTSLDPLVHIGSFQLTLTKHPQSFFGLWNFLSTQRWFEIWYPLKEQSKRGPIQTWFLGENYYLLVVLFQLTSLSFLVLYVTLNNSSKCSRTLNNNLIRAHLLFMCCCQTTIVWAFIQ
jgi:hypothetical protein